MYRFLIRLRFIVLLLLICQSASLFAQKDSLLLTNQNRIIGELKSMNQGVATVKTAYSKSDFKIKWGKVKSVNTETEFLITTKLGKRYNGFLQSGAEDLVYIINAKDTLTTVKIEDIVFLNIDRKSTRLNSSHVRISYAVFCLK